MFDVSMPQLLINVSLILIQELLIFLSYHCLSTMLTASLSRFHCALGQMSTSRLILSLLEKNDAVVGIGDSPLSISGEDPRSQHTVAAAIVYLESHIWQFELLGDLLLTLITITAFLII